LDNRRQLWNTGNERLTTKLKESRGKSKQKYEKATKRTHLLSSFALYHFPEIIAACTAAHAPVMFLEKD
jgi:hypothetical protein